MGINGGKPLLAQQFNRWRHMNHLPLSDAARGVTSAATLSRFESGQSMISSDVLGRLLVRKRPKLMNIGRSIGRHT